MFFDKYLNEIYLGMLYDKYENWYLEQLDENNFLKIYNLLKTYGFYFIEDIIIYYLEIFESDVLDVENRLLELKDRLGNDFVFKIGNDLSLLEELVENIELD